MARQSLDRYAPRYRRNPSAANLVNVAISRAKHALLIVGDVPYLRVHLGPAARCSG